MFKIIKTGQIALVDNKELPVAVREEISNFQPQNIAVV
jgi:hypothetical protein